MAFRYCNKTFVPFRGLNYVLLFVSLTKKKKGQGISCWCTRTPTQHVCQIILLAGDVDVQMKHQMVA